MKKPSPDGYRWDLPSDHPEKTYKFSRNRPHQKELRGNEVPLYTTDIVADWLTLKEEQIIGREFGKMSYRDEGVVKAVFHVLRKELLGEDPELFHKKASVEKKTAEGDATE